MLMLVVVVMVQVTVRKLVNAKYCDEFAHVVWKDGRVMHVNVTRELYRTYKRQLDVVNDAILRRSVSYDYEIPHRIRIHIRKVYVDLCSAFLRKAPQMRSDMNHTVLPANYTIPAFTPQPQNITALWLVFILPSRAG